jgi:hypothetical protein
VKILWVAGGLLYASGVGQQQQNTKIFCLGRFRSAFKVHIICIQFATDWFKSKTL